uniref:Methyltransferase FkbM domain-containing protein n=1 Tax=Chromera velia CCMP2878 TaxID=1169474 RepID=A0A0G4HXQ1_9ALVE|eukprot:Cvel_9312.t1-p1 / transcript=Cvel_9312.t1 / gene=Cvel_9312 / organism=Chromera_velia_CCMP2878 / gene_product=hypothetical protein / transcript_product=hypothetical protein / location=Cvel_scaffold533:79795-80868(-) / protein_length=358 / sequence_SO=supercontig / SO=protein_coding / is_pseudo=false
MCGRVPDCSLVTPDNTWQQRSRSFRITANKRPLCTKMHDRHLSRRLLSFVPSLFAVLLFPAQVTTLEKRGETVGEVGSSSCKAETAGEASACHLNSLRDSKFFSHKRWQHFDKFFDQKFKRIKEQEARLGNERKCVYIDLGANIGDEYEKFVSGRSHAKFNMSSSDLPQPWTCRAFLFEANPRLNPSLMILKAEAQRMGKMGDRLTVYPSTAAWISDGEQTFWLDTWTAVGNYWGSSLAKSHNDVVHSDFSPVRVKTVNFATWLLQTVDLNDLVIVSMDIEGAERVLLPHLILHQGHRLIDHLYLEWHGDSFFKAAAGEGDAGFPDNPFSQESEWSRMGSREYKELLEAAGVQVTVWP